MVAVLAAHWESGSEDGWVTRQVAGGLACVADVHVITPEGTVPDTRVDGAFSVHRLAGRLEPSAELRRDLLVQGISQTIGGSEAPLSGVLADLIDQDLISPWDLASERLDYLRPEVVVIAGYHSLGALVAVDRYDPDAPVSLLPLGADLDSLRFPHFLPLFDRAISTLPVTRIEYESIVGVHPRPDTVHRIGAPLAANQSALTEPDPMLSDSDYLLVLTGVEARSDHESTHLSQLLRVKFPGHRVAIVHDDGFFVWHRGRVVKGLPIERSGDMARLMAWARMTVDLRPGRLFARRCIESLLYGTPIVVPHNSRAREHAERGRGGLWFANPVELTWCVEALLDPSTRAALGTQGRAYAEEDYGSTDRFIDRVVAACGLTSSP